MTAPAILAIDQGTTSSRAMVFDALGNVVAGAQEPFEQLFPNDGWVEHNPEAIWSTSLRVMQQAAAQAEAQSFRISAVGITNQRETTVVWDKATGQPIYNAIVWQDRRTADVCQHLSTQGASADIALKTGLVVDPYFSATKITWILDNVQGARQRAEAGKLAFGTIDSFLIWRLTGGAVHATDATNAGRTSLVDIRTGLWDDELLRIFNVPTAVLPTICDSADAYGETLATFLGRPISILGVAGDQQAAAIGQCCFAPGHIKSTYGTGCFVLMNTGDRIVRSKRKLLSTIAYRLHGKNTYCLEGSIFIAGAAVQWLRDEMGIIAAAEDTEYLAARLQTNQGVYLVPAFTGLGAPYWNPDARGALFGITRNTGPAHIARAALESVAYQTNDLLQAMADDGVHPTALKVDGGMSANNWLMQFLSDITRLGIERPQIMETTALGAAYLAGYQAGLYDTLDSISNQWHCQRRFDPALPAGQRDTLLAGWQNAVQRTIAPL
ncbi:MAG: glycerol kinase GlpK [Deltaproteobacteria bacterium]|nr:glycerol kinase GlpK [Deltaproteobacteria bacterium]MBN2672788.1 glycerol kinase GlpK [Deltaproteobacteria bacterium]